MGAVERVFHAVLFEVLAVGLAIAGLVMFTDHDTGALSGTMILIATIAMAWNFIFNWVFDMVFSAPKEKRSLGLRIFHVVLFEAGLLILTIPVMAIILGVSFWEAFVMDVGVTVFITIYAFTFNWVYDNARASIIKKSQGSSSLAT
ncbi:hypothetical protein C9I98_02680 [Photobacterium sanctipauli]|uniref:Chlorhexidine efflux transporter domain-containing protein n=1 Tax=Photobacterium sanctipauli TaxID=1342794 RepID=A0A2T3P133_9GAMM|nr:PACE efflux transporter [Photobacterium sanctipauli]PSW22189.1 hypothetical protein C9I98_02680 [Photobacterium sanctipauli]